MTGTEPSVRDTIAPPSPDPRRRWERYARWTGLLVGVLAALWVKRWAGVDALYAIPVFGLFGVAGVLVGDALTSPTRGPVRTAGLAPRRIRDYAPPRMTSLLLVLAGSLVALLTVAGLTASRHGQAGWAGDTVTATCRGTIRTGAWPGFHHGLPILVSLAVATAACAWSLRRIAIRPGDEEARRERTRAVVGAWGLMVSTPLLGAASTASGTLMDMGCGGAPGTLAEVVLWTLAVVSLVTVPWTFATVCSPGAARKRHPGGRR